jgi:hypothetical protein
MLRLLLLLLLLRLLLLAHNLFQLFLNTQFDRLFKDPFLHHVIGQFRSVLRFSDFGRYIFPFQIPLHSTSHRIGIRTMLVRLRVGESCECIGRDEHEPAHVSVCIGSGGHLFSRCLTRKATPSYEHTENCTDRGCRQSDEYASYPLLLTSFLCLHFTFTLERVCHFSRTVRVLSSL